MKNKYYGIIITDYYKNELEENFKFEDFAETNYSPFLFNTQTEALEQIENMINEYIAENKEEYDLTTKKIKNTIKLYRKEKEKNKLKFKDNDLMTIFKVVEFTQKTK